MASGVGRHSTSVCKRRRNSSSSCGSGSTNFLGDDNVVHDQFEWRGRRRSKIGIKFLMLLLLVLFTSPVLVAAISPSVDYRTLTWSEWGDAYTATQSDAVAFVRMFRTGPRVRAKILVGSEISMNDFEAGEAIFRQRIQSIVGVERIERVQLEYLQTEACSEEEQQAFYVALGISALPPPLGTSGNDYHSDSSALLLPYINDERERIAKNLKYGNMVNSANVTIDSITLFGAPMELVDLTLEGETFTQLYLKPWVGIQLVIASTISVVMNITSRADEHYTMDRDAFQDLRLRFLITERLKSLQVRASDIIVRSPTELLPFTTYYADAGILEIEIHVHDILYADSVEGYLLGEDNSTSSNILANSFNAMEPDWRLIAIDVDTSAGELFSPPPGASPWIDTGNSGDSVTLSELTFELYNISLAQVERAKWSVLGYVRSTVSQVAPSLVRFGRITFPSSSIALSSLPIHNDGGCTAAAEASESIFDPINAINWTLSFKVEPKTPGAFDSVALSDHIIGLQSNVENGVLVALGFTDTTGTSSIRSVKFLSASDWVDPEVNAADVVDPYVSFTLTVKIEPLDAPGTLLESPNFFQLHHIRSALVLLLQQVAIMDDGLSLISSSVVDVLDKTSDAVGYTWNRLLYVNYRALIVDESQRYAIRSVIFSHQLASTIALYSRGSVELIERQIDAHADGSPAWPRYLPGYLDPVAEDGMVSDGFITSSKSLLEHLASSVYDFDDPEPSATSGALGSATDACASGGTSTSGLCIKLRFTGAAQLAPIFLRKLQSTGTTVSSSISLPPQHNSSSAADSNSSYPAPWVLVDDQSEILWSFFVDRSPSSVSSDQSLRLTFEAVSSMQDLSAVTPFTVDLDAALSVVRRRQFGDLALMDSTGLPVPAFIAAEVPEPIYDGSAFVGITITLNMQQPRLGGLYSGSLLDEVAPTCRTCTTLLEDCDSTPECRAFSACAGVLLESDLTLIAKMLEYDGFDTLDASWILRDCLSPSDGTEWSSTVREILESSYTCLWDSSCPLAHNTTLGKSVVLDYSPGEQILTFDLVNGFASMSFELDTDDGDLAYTFVEDFTANATEVAAQLDSMLTEMYRTAFSDVVTVKSSLVTTEDPDSAVVTAQLTIHYSFLGRLPQPLVALNSGTLGLTTTEETLYLRVIPIA